MRVRIYIVVVLLAGALALKSGTALSDPLGDWAATVSPPQPNTPIEIQTSSLPHLVPKTKEPCFPIRKVRIEGVELISQVQVRKAIADLAHTCLGNAVAKAILVKINALHAEAGYITTQSYVPEQDIRTSRVLRVLVQTGRIERVTYDEKPAWAEGAYGERLERNAKAVFTAKTLEQFFASLDRLAETVDDPVEAPLLSHPSARLAGALVLGEGDVLELEGLQQGIDQINRVPSARAKIKLEPGAKPATSHVKITNRPTDAFRMSVGYDTYGTETTGVNRARIDVARDNLFGLNETWSGTLTSAQNTNEAVGAFAVPLGWATLSAGGTYSETLVELEPAVELFSRSLTWNFDIAATLLRRRTRRLDISGGVKVYDNVRDVNDVRLTPQKVTTLYLGGSHRWMIGRSAAITLGLRGYVGLNALGAQQDPSEPGETAPRAQYRKGEVSVNAQWAMLPGVMLTSALTAQWSTTPLYSDNQLTLGSTSSIRGFKEEPINVDRGGHWRNELSVKPPVNWFFEQSGLAQHRWTANRLKAFTAYGFVDAGYGQDLANTQDDVLIGVGGGLRYQDTRITADLSYAQGVFREQGNKPDDAEIYLNVAIKVF